MMDPVSAGEDAAGEEAPGRGLARLLRLGRQQARAAGRIDIRRTWQVVVGAILIAAGPVLIVIGYLGTARTPFVEEQIPYLVSGGLLGVALSLLGGFLFWGHWLYRLMERHEYHQQRLYEVMSDLRLRLGGAPGVDESPAAGDGLLVHTGRGTVVHTPACPVVATRGDARPIDRDEALRRGYTSCRICEPAL